MAELFSRVFRANDAGSTEKQKNTAEKNRQQQTKQLANHIDVDFFGKAFRQFAGADEVMDADEFDKFTKAQNLTRQQAMNLATHTLLAYTLHLSTPMLAHKKG